MEDSGSVRRLHDHLLFNSLTTLGKILKECHLARATGTLGQMSQIWGKDESVRKWSNSISASRLIHNAVRKIACNFSHNNVRGRHTFSVVHAI